MSSALVPVKATFSNLSNSSHSEWQAIEAGTRQAQ